MYIREKLIYKNLRISVRFGDKRAIRELLSLYLSIYIPKCDEIEEERSVNNMSFVNIVFYRVAFPPLI